MELCIIKTLGWSLNPPTSSLFLNTLEPLLENLADHTDLSTQLKEHAKYLVELSICDSFFISMKPSCVAYGAVVAAMETLKAPPSVQHKLSTYRLDIMPDMIALCVERLLKMYGLAMSLHVEADAVRTDGQSPTSVFQR